MTNSFLYGEDLDLCYRIQKAGHKVFYVHSTQVIHYKGESTKRSNLDETKLFYDAMHLFVKKHLSSFPLVEIILRSAIGFRKLFAFIGKRKLSLYSAIADVLLFNISLFAAEKFYKNITEWVGFDPGAYWIVYTIPVFIHVLVAFLSGVYKKDEVSGTAKYWCNVHQFFNHYISNIFFQTICIQQSCCSHHVYFSSFRNYTLSYLS